MIRLPAESSKNGEAREIPVAGAVESFLHRDRKRIREFRGAWTKACQQVGLQGKLLHRLRRSGVRTMRRSGISEEVAMRISGHKTSSIFRRYNITSRAALAELPRPLGVSSEFPITTTPSDGMENGVTARNN